MRKLRTLMTFAAAVLITAGWAKADPKVDDQTLADSGKWAGFTLSPHGVHTAVLLHRGTHFVVSVDGTEGPRIDQLIGSDGNVINVGNQQSNAAAGITQLPILFSDDGAHCAYLATTEDEYVAIVDGKEMARGKYKPGAIGAGITITSGGQHSYFPQIGPTGRWQILMDGVAGPDCRDIPTVVTSADGSHCAYMGIKSDGTSTPFDVVDGKEVPYFGGDIQFTADGKLLGVTHDQGSSTLNIDGKARLKAGAIQRVWVSPKGGLIAVLINPRQGAPSLLTVNTKAVPGSEGMNITNIYFSPDDKHFAAFCMSTATMKQCFIIDGKKGDLYQSIQTTVTPDNGGAMARGWANGRGSGAEIAYESQNSPVPGFTADSSRFLYVVQVAGKSYLVSNDDESDPNDTVIAPAISDDGKHVAYIAKVGMAPNKSQIVMDGKTVTLPSRPGATISQGGTALGFSPDGSHYLYSCGGMLILDGVEQPGIVCGGLYLYSPDSKHLLFKGSSLDLKQTGLFLDGKLVATGEGIANATRPTFTPDSQHIFWTGHRPPETSTDYDSGVLYVDGKPTPAHFVESDHMQKGNWEVGSDGALTFITRTGGDLKKYHVTPDSGSGVAAMVAAGVDVNKK